MRKLNVGCGTDIRPGWVNLDIANLEGVDVVHDLQKLPLPFEDNHFDEIICYDILEHLHDYSNLLKELHRITAPGGTVEIKVPHFSYCRAYADPTHVRFFSVQTFEFFTESSGRSYYFDFAFKKLKSIRLTFLKRPRRNKLIKRLVNKNINRLIKYEERYHGLFPAENIIAILEK